MLLIKISVDQERLIRRANTDTELRNVKEMVVEQIDRAIVLKSFGKTETVKVRAFNWRDALAAAKEVLGESGVTVPPFPEPTWYGQIQGFIKRGSHDESTIRELAQYVKDHVRTPISLHFMLGQAGQIQTGRYDVAKPTAIPTTVLTNPGLELPEE